MSSIPDAEGCVKEFFSSIRSSIQRVAPPPYGVGLDVGPALMSIHFSYFPLEMNCPWNDIHGRDGT